jgi:hypothetical protein
MAALAFLSDGESWSSFGPCSRRSQPVPFSVRSIRLRRGKAQSFGRGRCADGPPRRFGRSRRLFPALLPVD